MALGGLFATAAEATDCVYCTFHAGRDGKNKHTPFICIHTTCSDQTRVHSKGASIYRINSWRGSNTNMRERLSSRQLVRVHGDKTYGGGIRKHHTHFVLALDTNSQTDFQTVPTVTSQRPLGVLSFHASRLPAGAAPLMATSCCQH